MKKITKIISLLLLLLLFDNQKIFAEGKIQIGLLVPLTGINSEIGNSIVKSVRLAINKIDNNLIEIIPKDTGSNPEMTLRAARELNAKRVKIVIGPVFNKNLLFLNEFKDLIFLSLTNKIIDNPKNIISAGINAESQFNIITKFQKINKLKKTKIHYYESDPTKLTKQIEKITRYSIRKQNLEDEITRLENSNENNKEKKIENLLKRDTLGNINFDSVIIADFDESLKSITTSLLYTDVSPKNISFITLNQWFDESLLNETSSQPIYFPSINKENYDSFIKTYYDNFNEYPNQLSFLSYDLIGLVYYLITKNNLKIDEKMFVKKSMFKGKIGIFEIKNNKINHILNFYKVENKKFKKVF